jgi:mitochondrial fission protein ELM1
MTWQAADDVWACTSPVERAGDVDQLRAIAWTLNPHYRMVELATEFERLRAAHAASPHRGLPALPRFIVGIGQHRVEMATTIRQWSGNRTKLVHIGNLRGSLDEIDYLITTPAYPTAPSSKVLCLDIAPSDRIRQLMLNASPMPGPGGGWINVFLGNPLGGEQRGALQRIVVLAGHLDRIAAQAGKDLLISGSPRTSPELYDALASALQCRHQLYRWAPNDPGNPWERMVMGSSNSIVTGDSISMLSQLVAARHRVLVFPWRKRPFDGLLKRFRPRDRKDARAFHASLYRQSLAAELDGRADFAMVTPRADLQDQVFRRLRSFLQ